MRILSDVEGKAILNAQHHAMGTVTEAGETTEVEVIL